MKARTEGEKGWHLRPPLVQKAAACIPSCGLSWNVKLITTNLIKHEDQTKSHVPGLILLEGGKAVEHERGPPLLINGASILRLHQRQDQQHNEEWKPDAKRQT